MQKIGLIAILITCFLFGIICGGAETNNTDIALKEEIEQFEEQITDKNNSYVPSVDIPGNLITYGCIIHCFRHDKGSIKQVYSVIKHNTFVAH